MREPQQREAVSSADPGEMSGLELLLSFGNDEALRPGVAILLGMHMTDIEHGRVAFVIDTRPEFGNPMGNVAGGIISTLVDSAMACAVHSALPARAGYATVDLGLTFVRAAPAGGGVVRAEGEVVHMGGRIATAKGTVTDGDDRLLATATTTCMIFRE